MGRLTGHTAIVTGGAAGIGGGVSRCLASEGALVILNDIDPSSAEATAAEITSAGHRCVPVVGDIRETSVVESVVGAAGNRIDILVNNVGDYHPYGRFVRTTEDDWRAQYAINFEHVLRCTHRVLPQMIEQGSGSIVNVSTVEAIRGIPGHAVYSAYNAAVIAFTRSLAVEVGRHGVRVNAIAPDMADTPQTSRDAKLRGRDPALIPSWVPLGRFGDPDDYAQVVLFLASDQSRFVTGQTIPVDGGTLSAGGWYGRADGRGWTNLPDRA
jgi:2-hydroxycyclohexanecarboxyl-CoA dehydrogenase